MGLLDFLFETPKPDIISTPVSSTSEIPEWMQEAGQQNYNLATQLADRPFPAFTGQRVADFTGDTQSGFDLTRGNVGSFQPNLNAAGGAAGDASNLFGQGAQTFGGSQNNINNAVNNIQGGLQTFNSQAANQYMSPFTEPVIQRTLDESNRQFDIGSTYRDAAAARGGSYGGARHGVLEAEALKEHGQNQLNTIANLNMQNFDQAQRQFNIEQQKQFQAGQGLLGAANAEQNIGAGQVAAGQGQLGAGRLYGDLGGLTSQYGAQDAASMMDIGRMQQELDQSNLNTAYGDYQDELRFPYENLNTLVGTLAGTPHNTTTNSEQLTTVPQSSVAGGLGGLLTGGLGLAGAFGAFR